MQQCGQKSEQRLLSSRIAVQPEQWASSKTVHFHVQVPTMALESSPTVSDAVESSLPPPLIPAERVDVELIKVLQAMVQREVRRISLPRRRQPLVHPRLEVPYPSATRSLMYHHHRRRWVSPVSICSHCLSMHSACYTRSSTLTHCLWQSSQARGGQLTPQPGG